MAKDKPQTALCYDEDFFEWTQRQADALRAGKWHELDAENLAEEIESLGKRDRRELGSRLQLLVMHLLKWAYQPEERSRSWRSTISTQRDEMEKILADSPSLRRQVPGLLASEFRKARLKTLDETGLPESALPHDCPWTVDRILDETFWPEPA